ncbi:hypothetical protein [Streptomyces sp. NPDC055794]
MGRELKDGEQIRLKGSAGALFLITVGHVFDKSLIEKRLASGEWSWPGTDPKPATKAKPEPRTEEKSEPGDGPQPREEVVSAPDGDAGSDPDRPAANAPKSEWVKHVARTQHLSLDDAANYTKADLIEMSS